MSIASAHTLIIGCKRPTALVALFHGMTGDSERLRWLAERWASALPSAAFVLFDARMFGTPGDWYRLPTEELAGLYPDGRFNGDYATYRPFVEDASNQEMVLRVVEERMQQINAVLDASLSDFGLKNDRLVLAGFSQGASIAAYAGLARRCLGVLPICGPYPRAWESLLPTHNETRTCVIVGDQDPHVPHEQVAAAFSKYRRVRETDGVHIVAGLDHRVGEEVMELGLSFLGSCGI